MNMVPLVTIIGKTVHRLSKSLKQGQNYLNRNNRAYRYENGEWVKLKFNTDFAFLDFETQRLFLIHSQTRELCIVESKDIELFDCQNNVILAFNHSLKRWKVVKDLNPRQQSDEKSESESEQLTNGESEPGQGSVCNQSTYSESMPDNDQEPNNEQEPKSKQEIEKSFPNHNPCYAQILGKITKEIPPGTFEPVKFTRVSLASRFILDIEGISLIVPESGVYQIICSIQVNNPCSTVIQLWKNETQIEMPSLNGFQGSSLAVISSFFSGDELQVNVGNSSAENIVDLNVILTINQIE